jgi:DHA2 family multidrug resistance protein
MGMLVVGIGALQYVLDKGQQEDWFASHAITALSVVSAVTLVALVIHQLRSKNPIIDLRVFKHRSYAVGVFLMTVVGFILYGSLVLLPVMLQTLFGYSSYEAGKAMAPRGVGSLLLMPIVGILTSKLDPRLLLVAGLTIGGVTLLWLGDLSLNAGFRDIFWPQFLQGAGMALLFVPLTTVSMAAIERERLGYATSLFNLMRNIGGSIGIAITSTMLQRQRQVTGTQLGEHLTIYDATTQSVFDQIRAGLIAAGADAVTATERTYAVMRGMLLREASMVSFVMLFRVLGVVFLVMIPLVALMSRPRAGGGPAAPAH